MAGVPPLGSRPGALSPGGFRSEYVGLPKPALVGRLPAVRRFGKSVHPAEVPRGRASDFRWHATKVPVVRPVWLQTGATGFQRPEGRSAHPPDPFGGSDPETGFSAGFATGSGTALRWLRQDPSGTGAAGAASTLC